MDLTKGYSNTYRKSSGLNNPRDQYKNVAVEPPKYPIPKGKSFNFNPFYWIWKLIKLIFNFLKLIKNVLITILILFIFGILAVIFVALYKPPFLWNPLKTFLNNEIQVINTNNENVDAIYALINEKGKKDTFVTLTDSQFSKIVFNKLAMAEENFIRFSKDKMYLYLNTDTKERPLWNVVSINIKTGEKMKIQSFGFGRFNTPQFVSGLLNDTLGTVFTFVENLVTSNTNIFAFNELMNKEKLDKSLTLNDVKVDEGKITLTYLVDKTNSGGY
jgi:hypothetical protein